MARYSFKSFYLLGCLVVLTLAPTAFSWNYGVDKIRGVNLGGWLVLEKWMVPKVFEGLPEHVNDEYKLCKHLGYTEAQRRLQAHWESWVTESDIIQMKNVGINHVRIPLGYWAFDIKTGEPWVKGSWDYAVKAAGWCKKHGIQVMMDLHGAPGSQNGNDHSGQSGEIRFFYDQENLQRAVNVVREIARWANAPEWRDTVSIIQVLNEPILWGDDYHMRLGKLKDYYGLAYHAIREVNDIAVVAVHDAFIDYSNWYYLRDLPEYWWVMLDAHIYQVFGDEFQGLTCEQHEAVACRHREKLEKVNQKLWTVIGEWSLATPKTCSNQAAIARQQIGVYEQYASGWIFWSHNNGQNWDGWSFMHSLNNSWIHPDWNNRAYC